MPRVGRIARCAGLWLMPVTLMLGGVTAGDSAKDPFDAMGVDRPAEPFSAPDVGFRSLEGREVRVRDLQGRAVLLGFFTTS